MQAYVLHIKQNWIQQDAKGHQSPQESSIYEAWCTERQAYVSAAKHLQEVNWPWPSHRALETAIKCLIEAEKNKEAVNLVNEQSVMTVPSGFGYGAPKILVTIAKSDYRGSPFE